MDVILLEKIHKLGNLGDQVKVRSGFGRNYLIPTGKAVSATTENIAKFEARRAELEKQHQDTLAIANGRAEKIDGLNVVISRRASAEGKLYGSIGTIDIVEAVNQQIDVEIVKHEVRLPEGPIRNVGEHQIVVQLHADVSSTITVSVVPEEEN